MRILLTGATGLIGKEVGRALTEAGHQLVAVTRSKLKAKLELPFLAEVIEWDGANSLGLSSNPDLRSDEIDGVIHLMGENLSSHRWTPEFKKSLVESRVSSTRNLVEALIPQSGAPARLKFWIQGSAIGFYGKRELSQPATEDTANGRGFLADLCQLWEAASHEIPSTVRKVVLRSGVVLSHQGGAFEKMLEPILQGVGGTLGGGHQALSVIHLADEVGFIVHAVESPKVEGAYNLVCEEPTTQRLLTEKLCQRLHVKMGPPAPALALKVLLGEMSSLVLDSLAVQSTRLQESGYRLRYPSIDTVLNELTSWYQHPVEERSPCYVKYEQQFIPRSPEEVFQFFSAAENLEKITPDFLNFKIQSMSTPEIGEGTEIRYQLKLHGFPVGWQTRIKTWDPPRRFIDFQEKGPYSLWQHEHTFTPVAGGTLIGDWIRYQLPLGKVGQWVGHRRVRADVEQIFAHRRKTIVRLLGEALEP